MALPANTPKLDLSLMLQNQGKPWVVHNEALVMLDALANLVVLDRDLSAAPVSPNIGDAYLVAGTPGAGDPWEGQGGKIAVEFEAWAFLDPYEGMHIWVADEDLFLFYDGAAWTTVGGSAGPTTNRSQFHIEDPVNGQSVGIIRVPAAFPTITVTNVEAVMGDSGAGNIGIEFEKGASRVTDTDMSGILSVTSTTTGNTYDPSGWTSDTVATGQWFVLKITNNTTRPWVEVLVDWEGN